MVACCALLTSAPVERPAAGVDPGSSQLMSGVALVHSEVATRGEAIGKASYYGEEFAGQPTASGETFDPGRLTAAHRSLSFGTRVRVTNLHNGKSIVVRINDRGPHRKGRIIDLSRRAATELGFRKLGLAQVRLEILR